MDKDKVISIEDQIKNRRVKETLAHYRGKKETIQRIIQCGSCHMRCAFCGLHVGCPEQGADSYSLPQGIVFCEGCRGEYEDYLSVTKKGKAPTVFWHNKEWEEMWAAWLEHRKALTAFVRSREFRLLVEDLDTNP